MIAEEIKIECEENGFNLLVDGERWLIADPEALYDHVKATIGPWLRERDEAFAEFRQYAERGTGPAAAYFACDPDESGGYDISDPKHPRYHSTHADVWDSREGK